MPMSALFRLCRFAAVLLLTIHAVSAAIPRVTGYSPVAGAPGTLVNIGGQNFGGLIDVRIGNTKATVQFASSTLLQIIVPPDALSGPINVNTTGGTGSSTGLNVPNFQVAPRVGDFYRDSDLLGQPVLPAVAIVGDRIYVRGANFDDPNRPNDPDYGLGVFVNGVRATQGFLPSPSSIQFIVPPGAGTGPVTVTNFAGAYTTAQLLYFQPVITAFTARAPTGGTVAVQGVNFTGITDVRFGNLPAASFTVLSGTNLVATVPPNAVNGRLTITAPGGSFISLSDFRVMPTVSGFSPTGGTPGTVVTIDGTALSGVTAVQFGGIPTDTFTNLTATRITAVVPATAVTGPITVVTANGTNASTASFFIAPAVTSFSPGQGAPGTTVRLTGRNFGGATAVRLGDTVVPAFSVDSATQITVAVPTGATTGRFRVDGPGGSGESVSFFLVQGNEPTVTGFAPRFGGSGATVRISGTHLAGVTNVTFAGVKAVFSVSGETEIVAVVPAAAATGPIEISAPAGRVLTASDFYVGNTTDLRTTLAVDLNPPVANGPLVCTWRLSNIGPVPATNAVGQITLPAGVTFFDGNTSKPFIFVNGGIRLTAGELLPGDSVVMTLRVMVGAPGPVPFTASVTNSITDNNAANNVASLNLAATAPRLGLEALLNGSWLLTWPAAGTNYVAQRRTALDAAAWTPVGGTPENDGSTLQLTLPATGEPAFFRVWRGDSAQ